MIMKTYLIRKGSKIFAYRVDSGVNEMKPYIPLLVDSVCQISNADGSYNPDIYFHLDNFKEDLLYEWQGSSELVIHPSSSEEAANHPDSVYRYRLILPADGDQVSSSNGHEGTSSFDRGGIDSHF